MCNNNVKPNQKSIKDFAKKSSQSVKRKSNPLGPPEEKTQKKNQASLNNIKEGASANTNKSNNSHTQENPKTPTLPTGIDELLGNNTQEVADKPDSNLQGTLGPSVQEMKLLRIIQRDVCQS